MEETNKPSILDVFKVLPTNEENNDFIIICGKSLASEKHFKSKGEAMQYIKKPQWDTTLALFAEMIDIKFDNEMKKINVSRETIEK